MSWGTLAGDGWEVALEDLLAEPAPGTAGWVTALSRRLVALAAARRVTGDAPRELRLSSSQPLPVEAVGTTECRLVIVGESTTRPGQTPLHARAGTWTWAALRCLGWDELGCLVTNALRPGGGKPYTRAAWRKLRERVPADAAWLAVGKVAAQALQGAGIPHVAVPHAAWHKRFKHDEGVQGYAGRLRAAGLPNGPLAHRPLPWAVGGGPDARAPRCEELPPLDGPAGELDPASVAHRRKADPASLGVDPQRLASARALFVSGECPSVKDAAERAGTDVERTRAASRAQGWRAEKRAAADRKARILIERYAEEEAAGLARLRLLAMTNAQLAFQGLQLRQAAAAGDAVAAGKLAAMRTAGDPEARPYHATPAGARALAQAHGLLRREQPSKLPRELEAPTDGEDE